MLASTRGFAGFTCAPEGGAVPRVAAQRTDWSWLQEEKEGGSEEDSGRD